MKPAGRASSGADDDRFGSSSSRATFSRPHCLLRFLLRGLLLTCLLTVPAVVSAERVSEESGFDYLYIVANEDGSSGGHVAVRLGHFVYHFQNEDSLLVLKRDRLRDFVFQYAGLENRTIHVLRVEVAPLDLDRIVEGFRRRHRAQEAQLRVARELARDRELLARLALYDSDPVGPASIDVPAFGYFLTRQEQRSAVSPTLVSLREALGRARGPDFLALRSRRIRSELETLFEADPVGWKAEPPASAYAYPAFEQSWSGRWLDGLAGLAALDVLERASPLDPAAHHAPRDGHFELSQEDALALGRVAEAMRIQLIDLFESGRSGWGQRMLLGMARLIALERSIESRRLVFLDAFPENQGLQEISIDPGDEAGESVLRENHREFEAARAGLRGRDEPDELAWERLEERSNRYWELLRVAPGGGPIRVAKGHLVPLRARRFPIPSELLVEGAVEEKQRLAAARRERDYARGLQRLYRYGLITRNCATALFETLGDGFGGSVARAETALGGHVRSRGSLAFIPFVSARQVDERFRVVARQTIPSYRYQRLDEMRSQAPSLWLALRESNTFSSKSYRRRSADSFFVFFTDRTIALRPVLGAVNLVAGLGQSIIGLVTAPVDRGRVLVRGLRGTFMSLPELFFWNIRKGSYDWIPPEHRLGEIEPPEQEVATAI